MKERPWRQRCQTATVLTMSAVVVLLLLQTSPVEAEEKENEDRGQTTTTNEGDSVGMESEKRNPFLSRWGSQRLSDLLQFKRRPAFSSWGGRKRGPAFSSWGGKRSQPPDISHSYLGNFLPSTEEDVPIYLSDLDGDRLNSEGSIVPEFTKIINDQLSQLPQVEEKRGLPAFNSWGGKRAPAFNSWGGKRAPAFNSWGGKRLPNLNRKKAPAFYSWGGKRSPAFNSWGGKRSPAFNSWGGKRAPAFNSWGGKRATAFNSWGGKRAPAFNSWGGKRAPAFNSWGGKRSPSFNSWGGKRATAFNSWGGKRAPAFNSWGGKRATAFNSWGGKRAPSFNSWGGKRVPAFNSWGGKRATAFNSWGGKRAAKGGKKNLAFNSWGGKRTDETTINADKEETGDGNVQSELQNNSSSLSKINEYEIPDQDEDVARWKRYLDDYTEGKRGLPAFSSWGGKRGWEGIFKPNEDNTEAPTDDETEEEYGNQWEGGLDINDRDDEINDSHTQENLQFVNQYIPQYGTKESSLDERYSKLGENVHPPLSDDVLTPSIRRKRMIDTDGESDGVGVNLSSWPATYDVCCFKRVQFGDRKLFMQMLLRTKGYRDSSWPPTIRPIRRGADFYPWGGKRSSL